MMALIVSMNEPMAIQMKSQEWTNEMILAQKLQNWAEKALIFSYFTSQRLYRKLLKVCNGGRLKPTVTV